MTAAQRRSLLVLVVVALLGALVFVALRLVHVDETTPQVPPTDGEQVAPAPVGDVDFSAEPMSEAEARRRMHRAKWPFGDFALEIQEILRPGRAKVHQAVEEAEIPLRELANQHKITVRMERATFPEVVDFLAREFEPHGMRVYTLPPAPPEDLVFENLYLTDVDVWGVIRFMTLKSQDQITFALTPEGLCVGTPNACIQARLNQLDWEARIRDVSVDEDDAFLDAEYRPDFRGAEIGSILKDIVEKTGVQVIVNPAVWEKPVTMTWRAEPLPLRRVLARIAQHYGAQVHTRDGRAYVLIR